MFSLIIIIQIGDYMTPDEFENEILRLAKLYNEDTAPEVKGPNYSGAQNFLGTINDRRLWSNKSYDTPWGSAFLIEFGQEILFSSDDSTLNIERKVNTARDEIYFLTMRPVSSHLRYGGHATLVFDGKKHTVREVMTSGMTDGIYDELKQADGMKIEDAIGHFFKVVYGANGYTLPE